MTPGERGRVVFQPVVYHKFGRGVDTIVNALKPTLGPRPRTVALGVTAPGGVPEVVDHGATIARRIIALPDRDEDMGAMFARHLIWRVHEQAGDGTATAGVLFQALYHAGVGYVMAGGDAQLLRRRLEAGMQVILDELDGMAVPVAGKQQLARVAEGICYDPELAALLGEIFDIIGGEGRLDIREGHGLHHEREYVDGMYWENSGVCSPHLLVDQTRMRTDLEHAAIAITDLEIDDPRDLVPLIAQAEKANLRAVVLLCSHLAEPAIPWLLAASQEPEKLRIIAARTPGAEASDQADALEDLAILCGGRALLRATGDSLRSIKVEQLGRARRAWADRRLFGVVGGKGHPRQLRAHVRRLRAAVRCVTDEPLRKRLEGRIARLLGGSATLYVGGISAHDIQARKAVVERTAEALRGVVREGVVPGGGVALLRSRPALKRMLDDARDPVEQAGYRMLLAAIQAPCRTILANAGYDPGPVLARFDKGEAASGIDVRRGDDAPLVEAAIFDAVAVQRAVVQAAVGGAALALTIDVLLHAKRPEQSVKP